MSRRSARGRSMKVGSWGIHSAMPSGRRSTIPDLIVACVVGDGEAETGPLATAWHSNKFLNPITDGAVLPILHLNGYKIANPTVLARISHEELEQLFRGYGWTPYFVEGDEPAEDASTHGRCSGKGHRGNQADPKQCTGLRKTPPDLAGR